MEELATIAVIPTDMKTLHRFRGVPVPIPSLEHTLTRCGACGREAWIGPAQRLHVLFHGGNVRCYWCMGAEMQDRDFEIMQLDATADEKQRRW